MQPPKTVLESMLLDPRVERVKMVAGMAYGGCYITKGIGETLDEIAEALEKNDHAKALERLEYAKRQCVGLQKVLSENLASFVRYVETKENADKQVTERTH
jgi:UDP-glucose 6-dehydrogenase